MALPGSGQLAFSQIINEFGTPGGKNLGAFRVSENIGAMSDVRLDTGMPSSGQIAFSDFRGKQLNVVVNFYTGGQETRQNAKNRYDGNNVRVVGGFRGRPSNTNGTRVIIHVNKNIGSEKRGRNKVALRTGNWDGGTNLDLINNGNIYGAGGDGGNGGNRSSGKPIMLLRQQKTPPGPQKPLPGPPGPPRGSFQGLSMKGCKHLSDLKSKQMTLKPPLPNLDQHLQQEKTADGCHNEPDLKTREERN